MPRLSKISLRASFALYCTSGLDERSTRRSSHDGRVCGRTDFAEARARVVVVRISRERLEKNKISCGSNGHFFTQRSQVEVLYLFPMQSDRNEEMQDCEVG